MSSRFIKQEEEEERLQIEKDGRGVEICKEYEVKDEIEEGVQMKGADEDRGNVERGEEFEVKLEIEVDEVKIRISSEDGEKVEIGEEYEVKHDVEEEVTMQIVGEGGGNLEEVECEVKMKIEVEDVKVQIGEEHKKYIKREEEYVAKVEMKGKDIMKQRLNENGVGKNLHKKDYQSDAYQKNFMRDIANIALVCDICWKGFETRSALSKHVNNMHKKKAEHKYQYDKVFMHVSHLNWETSFTCENCGKLFLTLDNCKSEFPIRKAEHVAERMKCYVCEKGFTHRSTLRRHMKLHGDNEQHLCNVCGESYFGTYDLIVHKRQHIDSKSCICNTCEETFTSK